MRVNGHLLLNGEKMSKSKRNFLTLSEMVHKYGADASRIALADAGDGISDANPDEDVADITVLRLFTLGDWCKSQYLNLQELRPVESPFLLIDQLFDDEMNLLTHECRRYYEETFFKLALKSGLYGQIGARG